MKFLGLAKKAILALSLTASVSAVATDGTNSGGGGVGFYCNINGKMKAFLADTIKLQRTGQLYRMKTVDFSQAVEVIDQHYPQKAFQHPYVRGQKVTLGFMLSHSLNGLKFIRTNETIPATNDDHIPASSVPGNCKKIQLARQYFATKTVLMRGDVELSAEEEFYLNIHEAMIALRNRPGMNTTEIRQKVANLSAILTNPSNFALAVLKEVSDKWADKKIVPQDQQTRYRTLYYAPRQLMCETTWIGPRSEFRKVDMAPPARITLTRTQGDGRVGEHNRYTVTATAPVIGAISRNLQIKDAPARLYTESYNAFGEADGIGTFALSFEGLKFNPSVLRPNLAVEMDLAIDEYDKVTNEYLGSYEMNDPESLRVVEIESGYGLRCWPSEAPIFRHDDRSEVYAPACILQRTPGCRE
jgi:hypothetical protein